MIVKANIKEEMRSLLAAKQRTLLALIGIFVGIGSVIAMVSVGTIVQNEALRQFREMGTDILTIGKEFGGGSQSRQDEISLDDALEIPNYCRQISAVEPYASSFGKYKYEGKKWDAPILGVTKSFLDLNKLTLREGRFISDLDHRSYLCVAGDAMGKKLRSLGVKHIIGTQIFFPTSSLPLWAL